MRVSQVERIDRLTREAPRGAHFRIVLADQLRDETEIEDMSEEVEEVDHPLRVVNLNENKVPMITESGVMVI